MLNLKNYLIIDTLVSSSLVAGLLVVVDIDHECKSSKKTGYSSYIYISFIAAIYTFAVLASIYFAYRILKNLKKKFFEFKHKAFHAFCKMLWFPFIVVVAVGPLIVFTFYRMINELLYFGILFFSNMSGVYLLIGVLVTDEFRDGIEILKESRKLFLGIR